MYKILYLDEFEDVSDVEWKLTIDIINIWKEYKKNNNLDLFITNYKNILISKKEDILNIDVNAWNDLNKILLRMLPDIEKPNSFYDDIYDWGDKYLIKIKCE